jgi:predicted MFS family arabinose efflux permease
MAYGALVIGALLSRRQSVAMALLFGAGFCLVSAFSTLNSFVQENAPQAFRGRVLSIHHFAFRGGMPVGSLVAGALVGRFGVPAVIGSFAALLVLLAAAIYLRPANSPLTGSERRT